MSPLQLWMLILLAAGVVSARVKINETNRCKVFKPSSPLPAAVFAPEAPGSYPVIVFHPGTFCSNHDYFSILKDIASEGFIVAAPASTLNPAYFFTAAREVRDAGRFITWLSKNINSFLKTCMELTSVQADVNKLVGMGHSRGGKVAFALALGLVNDTDPVSYSAIVGLDPVDHPAGSQLYPHVLKNKFELPYPSLLIGSELGPQPVIPVLIPACAPRESGYMAFFANILSTAFEFVAHQDGHMDFLDEGTWDSTVGRRMCVSGSQKHAQKVATSTTIAFLKAALLGVCDEFTHLLNGPSFVNSTGALKNCISSVASA